MNMSIKSKRNAFLVVLCTIFIILGGFFAVQHYLANKISYAARDGIAFVDSYIAENPVFEVYFEQVNQGKTRAAAGVSCDASLINITLNSGINGSAGSKGRGDGQ